MCLSSDCDKWVSPLHMCAYTHIYLHDTHSHTLQVWKARLRTRDLLGAMNCVQCNLCRLHGKVAALGLSVGLQVLI